MRPCESTSKIPCPILSLETVNSKDGSLEIEKQPQPLEVGVYLTATVPIRGTPKVRHEVPFGSPKVHHPFRKKESPQRPKLKGLLLSTNVCHEVVRL